MRARGRRLSISAMGRFEYLKPSYWIKKWQRQAMTEEEWIETYRPQSSEGQWYGPSMKADEEFIDRHPNRRVDPPPPPDKTPSQSSSRI